MKHLFSLLGLIFLVLLLGAYIGWNVVQDTLGLRPAELRFYLVKGERLVLVRKPLLAGQYPVKDSLHALLQGPDAEALKKGYLTALPQELKLVGVTVENDTVLLKVNDGFDRLSGGSSQIRAAIAQLVYTATAQKSITKVVLSVAGKEGQPLVIGGEGLIIDKVQTRESAAF